MPSGAAALSGLLLVLTVGAVGVLHTAVPDHWVPIVLLARQRGWTRRDTARAAAGAGVGHVVTTLLLGLAVWLAGAVFARRFGQTIDIVAGAALVLFGFFVAASAWRDRRRRPGHGHSHRGPFGHHHHHHHETHPAHGPERQLLDLGHGAAELSIHDDGAPPRFRFTGRGVDWVRAETVREDGARQFFTFARRPGFSESVEPVPEPHRFEVLVTAGHGAHEHAARVRFPGHVHGDGHHHGQHEAEIDPLYKPLPAGVAVLARHAHAHRHGTLVHAHWHDHDAASAHDIPADHLAAPPAHAHRHRSSGRMALPLILGSSPMLEGIPAFFAASRYGVALLVLMAAVFALGTILTYVALCLVSLAGLRRLGFGPLERHGEMLSGLLIAVVGIVFTAWPLL